MKAAPALGAAIGTESGVDSVPWLVAVAAKSAAAVPLEADRRDSYRRNHQQDSSAHGVAEVVGEIVRMATEYSAPIVALRRKRKTPGEGCWEKPLTEAMVKPVASVVVLEQLMPDTAPALLALLAPRFPPTDQVLVAI